MDGQLAGEIGATPLFILFRHKVYASDCVAFQDINRRFGTFFGLKKLFFSSDYCQPDWLQILR